MPAKKKKPASKVKPAKLKTYKFSKAGVTKAMRDLAKEARKDEKLRAALLDPDSAKKEVERRLTGIKQKQKQWAGRKIVFLETPKGNGLAIGFLANLEVIMAGTWKKPCP
jgi:hypothetical protein